MAKFRKNHNLEKKGRSNANTDVRKTSVRYIIWLGMILAGMYFIGQINGTTWDAPIENKEKDTSDQVSLSDQKVAGVEKNFLPTSTTGEVVHHSFYSLSYAEEHEQAEWVAYKLTEESLRKPNVKRASRFNPDNSISTRSAVHSDYSHSGYTRGHLAPAGDMAFSIEAMQESFYMSNMTPQVKECNGGIWRELEENVRDWAFDNDELYIVSGPILANGHVIKKIGKKNKVSVPDAFYKIILDNEGSERKAIAFLIPNEKSTQPLRNYATSIDEIEALTGINFFADFLSPEDEQKLESMNETKGWKFDRKKFEKRIHEWNKY